MTRSLTQIDAGVTLHDIHFMGQSTFYRLSLSEMFVPYGDPRGPIHRKGTIGLGNVGAGVTANNLQRRFADSLCRHSLLTAMN